MTILRLCDYDGTETTDADDTAGKASDGETGRRGDGDTGGEGPTTSTVHAAAKKEAVVGIAAPAVPATTEESGLAFNRSKSYEACLDTVEPRAGDDGGEGRAAVNPLSRRPSFAEGAQMTEGGSVEDLLAAVAGTRDPDGVPPPDPPDGPEILEAVAQMDTAAAAAEAASDEVWKPAVPLKPTAGILAPPYVGLFGRRGGGPSDPAVFWGGLVDDLHSASLLEA